MKKIISMFLFLFSTEALFAHRPFCDTQLLPYKSSFTSLLSENDAYADQYVDRYYTAGTSISYTSREYDFICKHKESPMAWSRFIGIGWNKIKMTRFNISLIQDIYTPYSRIANPVSDHPYAGYFRFNFGVIHRSESALESTFVSIGMVGPVALGYETQTFFHYLTNNPIFYGWSHQLKNEFIFNLNYQRIKKFYLWDTKYFSSDILPAFDIALGNADTHFRIGSRIRVGYNLNSDFGVNKVNTSFSGSEPYSNRFSFYAFGGISGSYQARDIFIQGNTFGKGSGLKMEHFIYDGELGAAIMYRGVRFSYTYTHTSKRYKSQPISHDFGSIELNVSF